jgi:hypothetical protein
MTNFFRIFLNTDYWKKTYVGDFPVNVISYYKPPFLADKVSSPFEWQTGIY